MRRRRKSKASIILLFLPVVVCAAEFQFDWIERLAGAYLEHTNPERPRLAKFVEQEARNRQAIEEVQSLLTRKAARMEGKKQRHDEQESTAEVVRLEGGQKLIMTRAQFLAVHQKLDQLGKGLPQVALVPDMEWQKEWMRSILVRAGWLQKGELFFVDNNNYILSRTPLSSEQFDLLDAYASASKNSPFDNDSLRVYTPQRFFAMLRGLPPATCNQIIPADRFLDIEATACRVGISEMNANGEAELFIETIAQGRIEVISIPITGDLLQEIKTALGEENPEAGTSLERKPN